MRATLNARDQLMGQWRRERGSMGSEESGSSGTDRPGSAPLRQSARG